MVDSPESCQNACLITDAFRGFHISITDEGYHCTCLYDFGNLPATYPEESFKATDYSGTGPIGGTNGAESDTCYKYLPNNN